MKIFAKTGFFKFAPKRWSKVLFPENKRPVFFKILQQISYFLAFFFSFLPQKTFNFNFNYLLFQSIHNTIKKY